MTNLDQDAATTKTEREALRDRLISEERVTGTLIGGVIGAVPGFVLYAALMSAGVVPVIAYFAPGVFVGYGARFLGRGIRPIHGRVAAFVVLVFLAAVWWFLGLDALALAFSLPNVLIAGLLAPRKLTRDEGAAVYDYRIGR